MGHFSALLVVILSFLLVYLWPRIQRDPSLLLACWLTIAAHSAAAFINAFITPLTAGWGDLYVFHEIGIGHMNKWQPYGYFLRWMYGIFGASFWFGEQLSVLCFSISLIVLVEIQARLGMEKHALKSVLLYGLLPGPLAHCSVTMRESYQALGFLTSMWVLICIRQDGISLRVMIPMLVALGTMVFMHQSLAVYALAIFTCGLPWALGGAQRLGGLAAVLLVLGLPLMLPAMSSMLKDDSATLRAADEGRLLEYVASYRDNVNNARSDYGLEIETDSVAGFVVTSGMVAVMYFLAPLPWQISSTLDYYAFFEVVLRLFLLAGFVYSYKRANKEQRSCMTMLFVFTMLLEFMWAMGTTNWGTALRHHVPAFGGFVILGGALLDSFSLDPEQSRLEQRRLRRRMAT
ncbi:hypothetical protein JST97_07320 [bacterium]|nr:hypothetical protein [bacterium]